MSLDAKTYAIDDKVAKTEPSGTFLSSWTVMAKTMIGVGMLGLPAATAACGWIVGMLLLAVAGAAALFSLHLLNRLSMNLETRCVSFYAVAERVAPWSRWIVDIAIAVKCAGVGTGYLQVGGTQFSSFIKRMAPEFSSNVGDTTLRFIVVFGVAILLSPVCFRKRLAKTAVVNALGIIGLTYVVAIALVYCEPGLSGSISLWPAASAMGIIAKFPVFIFTFTCHQNMFLVAEELKDRTQKRLDLIAVLSELSGLCLFLPALICPYLTYGDSVKSNFVDNMDSSQLAIQIGKIILGVAEVCAFPLQLYPCRKSIAVLVTRGRELTVREELWFRRILTFVILFGASVVATFVTDLGITLRLVGIIGSNTICYIMPTFLYCMTFKADARSGCAFRKVVWWCSAGLCAVAVVLLPLCLAAIIQTAVGGH